MLRNALRRIGHILERALLGAPCHAYDLLVTRETIRRNFSHIGQVLTLVPGAAILIVGLQLLLFVRADRNLAALILEFEGIGGLASRSLFVTVTILLPSTFIGLAGICTRPDLPHSWRAALRGIFLPALILSVLIVPPLIPLASLVIYIYGNIKQTQDSEKRTHRQSDAINPRDWASGNRKNPDSKLRALAERILADKEVDREAASKEIADRQKQLNDTPGLGVLREFVSTSIIVIIPLLAVASPSFSATYSVTLDEKEVRAYILRSDGRNLVIAPDENTITVANDNEIREATPCRDKLQDSWMLKPVGERRGENLSYCPS